MVSSCYNHFSFACVLNNKQYNKSLRHVITGILIPERLKWAYREALFALTVPGHLNYGHVVEFIRYM